MGHGLRWTGTPTIICILCCTEKETLENVIIFVRFVPHFFSFLVEAKKEKKEEKNIEQTKDKPFPRLSSQTSQVEQGLSTAST